jgi:hypothetical protein
MATSDETALERAAQAAEEAGQFQRAIEARKALAQSDPKASPQHHRTRTYAAESRRAASTR